MRRVMVTHQEQSFWTLLHRLCDLVEENQDIFEDPDFSEITRNQAGVVWSYLIPDFTQECLKLAPERREVIDKALDLVMRMGMTLPKAKHIEFLSEWAYCRFRGGSHFRFYNELVLMISDSDFLLVNF